MKAVTQNRSGLIPSVALRREDVEKIISIIEEAFGSASISDDKYEYADLDELTKRVGRRPAALVLKSTAWEKGHVSVRFVRWETWGTSLNATLETAAAESAYLKIRELLRERARWLTRLLPVWPVMLAMVALIVLGRTFLPEPARSVVTLALIGLLFISIFARNGLFYSIDLTKGGRESFYRRNADKIWVGVISAILAGLAVWVAERMFGK